MGIFNDLEDHSHDTRDVRGYVAGLPGPRGFTGPEGPRGEKGEAGLTEKEVKDDVVGIVELIDLPNPFVISTILLAHDLGVLKLTSSQTPIGVTTITNVTEAIRANTFEIRTPTTIDKNGNFVYNYSLSYSQDGVMGSSQIMTIFFDLFVDETPYETSFELVPSAGIEQIGSMTHTKNNDFYRIRTSFRTVRVSGDILLKTKFLLTYDNKKPTLDSNNELVCHLSIYGVYGNPIFDTPNPKDKSMISYLDEAHSNKRIRISKRAKYYPSPPLAKLEKITTNGIPSYEEVIDRIKEELKGWFEKEFVRLMPFPGSKEIPSSWRSVTMNRSTPPDLPRPGVSGLDYGVVIFDFDQNSDFEKAKLRNPLGLFGTNTNDFFLPDHKDEPFLIIKRKDKEGYARNRLNITLDMTGVTKTVPQGRVLPSKNIAEREPNGIWIFVVRRQPDFIIPYRIGREPIPSNFSYQGQIIFSTSSFDKLPDYPPFLYVASYYNYETITLKITYD